MSDPGSDPFYTEEIFRVIAGGKRLPNKITLRVGLPGQQTQVIFSGPVYTKARPGNNPGYFAGVEGVSASMCDVPSEEDVQTAGFS